MKEKVLAVVQLIILWRTNFCYDLKDGKSAWHKKTSKIKELPNEKRFLRREYNFCKL